MVERAEELFEGLLNEDTNPICEAPSSGLSHLPKALSLQTITLTLGLYEFWSTQTFRWQHPHLANEDRPA